MTSKVRNASVVLIILALIAGFALYMGGGTKEVVIEAPSEAEQAEQMEKMTPEQRQAVEGLLDAMRSQAQDNNAPQ